MRPTRKADSKAELDRFLRRIGGKETPDDVIEEEKYQRRRAGQRLAAERKRTQRAKAKPQKIPPRPLPLPDGITFLSRGAPLDDECLDAASIAVSIVTEVTDSVSELRPATTSNVSGAITSMSQIENGCLFDECQMEDSAREAYDLYLYGENDEYTEEPLDDVIQR